MGLLDGYFSLGENSSDRKEGALAELPELSLDLSDAELVDLATKWEKKWRDYEPVLKKQQEANENYYLGKQHNFSTTEERGVVDNVIFEAVETFLPQATKKNPDPVVRSDDTEEGINLSKSVQKMLSYHADRLRLRLRGKRAIRYWVLYLVAYMKHGWDQIENDIDSVVNRPQNLILDPDAYIDDNMEYMGEYLGENMETTAAKLIARFPEKKEYITKKVNGQLGTKVKYTEWWTPEYVFWQCGKEVLGKAKNPHWNYDEETEVVDEYGMTQKQFVEGKNHFPAPKIPYTFLSIFNLGQHPHDETSLIGQNIPNQDIINKRNCQIDRNADSMNGGLVVSGDRSGLSREQAALAGEALRKGGTIYVAQGAANEAVYRDQAPGLPADIFNQLADMRNETRNIFGISGSNAEGIKATETATGKAIVREADADRIGGGISEHLEQFYDNVYNWWVQLMYVYYDETHVAAVVGKEKASEYIKIHKDDFDRKLTVSVKEGSLIPDSDAERALEAKELLVSGNLDPITAYDRMGYPDPKETAERTYFWKADPTLLLPEAGAQVEAKAEQQMLEQAALAQEVQPQV